MRQGFPWGRGGPSAALAETVPPEAARSTLARAKAIVEFADRNPALAFESGLESIATESRLLLGAIEGPNPRGQALAGALPYTAMQIAVFHRAGELQREALRRVVRHHDRLSAEQRGPSLGETLQTAFSIASSAVWMAMAFA